MIELQYLGNGVWQRDDNNNTGDFIVTGSLGVGTAAPAQKIHVVAADSRLRLEATSASGSAATSLAVVNARIWTGDARRPWADGLAAEGERLTLVGSSSEVKKLVGPATRVIDAHGMMVVPGFIDSHVHFSTGGFGLSSVQLRDAKTPAEFISRIKTYAATLPAGAWITEGNWDHEQWGGELPRRDWIDSVTPNNPVWINRLDGHMSLANSAAKNGPMSAGTSERITSAASHHK